MARKNQSQMSPPLLSAIDFSSAVILAFQSPVRKWATPKAFRVESSLRRQCDGFLGQLDGPAWIAELDVGASRQQPS